jgi:signal transduction histidine kinase
MAAEDHQTLLNLLSSAAKFTTFGVIDIHVALHHADDGRDQFAFEVRDTGVGISADRLAHILQPFSQADAQYHTRRYRGAGLGLTISRSYCELMSGGIKSLLIAPL